MKNSTKFIIFLVIGLIILAFYLYIRNPETSIEELRQERATVVSEEAKLRIANQELEELANRYSIKVNMAEFVEHLYLFAREAGISDHQLVTKNVNTALGQGGTGRSTRTVNRGAPGFHIRSMEIVLTGGYRNIAEYIRLVQTMDNPTRITQLTMKPLKDKLQLKMILELYSYGEENGS